jgi:uncharacterized PurR-regulated membrane protein YhhQ (DUF165 family)
MWIAAKTLRVKLTIGVMRCKMFNMNKVISAGADSLLIAGVILFNIASAYTTKRGLDLIFQDQEGFGVMLPWVLAIGCAAFLVFLTFAIASRQRGSRIVDIVIAYLIIASFSIFCNFSFIYTSLSGRSVENENYRELRSILAQLIGSAREHLGTHLRVTELEESLAKAKVQREFEKDRRDRPGEGSRWLALDEKVRSLEGELQLQNKRLSDATSRLDEAQSVLSRQGEPVTAAEARAASREIFSQIVQVSAHMSVYSFESNLDLKKLGEKVNSGSIEHNLRALFDEISLFVDGSLDRLSTYRFMLSAFLSIVLDTALFIVVAVRRAELQQRQPEQEHQQEDSSPRKLWDEKLW